MYAVESKTAHCLFGKKPTHTDTSSFHIVDFAVIFLCISRHFYPKRLTAIQVIHVLPVCVFHGNEPTTFCAPNAMFYHWAREHFFHLFPSVMKCNFCITKLKNILLCIPRLSKPLSLSLTLGETTLSKTESPHPEFSGLLPPIRKSHKDSTGTAMHF